MSVTASSPHISLHYLASSIDEHLLVSAPFALEKMSGPTNSLAWLFSLSASQKQYGLNQSLTVDPPALL